MKNNWEMIFVFGVVALIIYELFATKSAAGTITSPQTALPSGTTPGLTGFTPSQLLTAFGTATPTQSQIGDLQNTMSALYYSGTQSQANTLAEDLLGSTG
jgi:hypothetical protein